MRILGVDPGCYGALTLLVDGRIQRIEDMPNLKLRRGKSDKAEIDGYSLAALLRELAPDLAVIEQVGGMEGQAAGAAFNFGRAAGAPEYMLKAMGVRVEMVAPATWKKFMKLKGGKDASREAAMRLWPMEAGLFSRVKDNDRAEAALIAEWGRQHFEKGETNVSQQPGGEYAKGYVMQFNFDQTGVFT